MWTHGLAKQSEIFNSFRVDSTGAKSKLLGCNTLTFKICCNLILGRVSTSGSEIFMMAKVAGASESGAKVTHASNPFEPKISLDTETAASALTPIIVPRITPLKNGSRIYCLSNTKIVQLLLTVA
tara:strand:+ start:763 stop:1137 length:375 start_codon:yes stop_codon:yes gene_type:complete